MSENLLTTGETQAAPQSVREKAASMALFGRLASVKFAVGVVIVIAMVCVVGTLLPQGPEAAAYIGKSPNRAAARLLETLRPFGFTQVFYSWWFIGLLCVLASSVMTCSARRFATARRSAGVVRTRAIGSMLTHISILLILGGGVVRGIWGTTGYIELREGETKNEFAIENGVRPLPFALQLTRFEIQTDPETKLVGETHQKSAHQLIVQWPSRSLFARVPLNQDVTHALTPQGEPPTAENTFKIKVLRYVPDFAMNADTHEIVSKSEQPNNPAVLVQVDGPRYQNNRWVFANHPDLVLHSSGDQPSPLRMLLHSTEAASAVVAGPIRNFKSSVRIVENGNVVRADSLAVNSPLSHRGYRFYQTGYDPRDLSWTSLQVVRDPGVPLVYAGFALIIAGLFTVFYLNPWLESRRARA